ncbi:MAG: HAMP domain-containing histidine kinase [Planctomycetes bacterium]|nr:HAMP domain-containing histidine kinase [Planctomycetota bacterium]
MSAQEAAMRAPGLRRILERVTGPLAGSAPAVGQGGAAKTTSRGKYFLWHGLIGFVNGYVFLHPLSMVIFRLLDPCFAGGMPDAPGHAVWAPIFKAFQPNMVPMGLMFGVVGAVVASIYGYQRRAIHTRAEELEEQLAVNARLVGELKENTAALESKNMRLRELERERERTTHFIVHDFKGYLGCISGFAKRALKAEATKKDPTLSDALVRIQRQSEKMLADTRNLLDLARLQERSNLKMEPVVPEQLLREVLDDLTLHVRRGMVTIDESGGPCPAAPGEPALLRRVLWNLAVNALKHNEPGTRVALSARHDKRANRVIFSCADKGRGVHEETLPRLFEDFETGNTGGNADGNGLGLAFCKSAVEAHGGRIWCESEVGNGARFCFSIPCEEGEENDE